MHLFWSKYDISYALKKSKICIEYAFIFTIINDKIQIFLTNI